MEMEMIGEGRKEDIIIGNNVMEKVNEIKDLVRGMKIIMKKEGVIKMELKNIVNMIEKKKLEKIYKENF